MTSFDLLSDDLTMCLRLCQRNLMWECQMRKSKPIEKTSSLTFRLWTAFKLSAIMFIIWDSLDSQIMI